MSEKFPPPKGRGAVLMKLLAQLKEQKPGEQSQPSESTEEPPRPRGRAVLMQKIAEMRAARKVVVGEEPGTSREGGSSACSTVKVEEVTEKLEVATLAEPCFYKGSKKKMNDKRFKCFVFFY